jgi:hypothetical protein|tara:strand:- start:324 stop:1028 length:705 start_codon:yes stop_codon:yes gene_type:complete
MAALTYSTLVTQIKNTMEDDSTEFSDSVPDFIRRAELRLTREMDSHALTQYATSRFTEGEAFLALPSNNLIVKNVNYLTSLATTSLEDGRSVGPSTRISLLLRTKEYLEDYWPVRTSTGLPKYYTHFRNDQILMAPSPTSALDVELAYVVQPSALSVGNETNYYTTFCENALFYASMIEACYFNKNVTAVQIWDQQYQREIITLVNESRRNRRDDMSKPNSPAGGADTLIDGAN